MAAPPDKPYRVYRGGRAKGKVPLSGRDGKTGSGRSDGAPPAPPPLGVEARAPRRRPAAARPPRDLVVRRLPVRAQRRRSRAQTAAGGDGVRAHAPGRADPRLADEHPAARHRPRHERPGGPQLRRALRLDDAAARRPEAAPPRLPLDPARPPRDDSRLRRPEDQRRDADRRAEARDPDRPATSPACRSTTSSSSTSAPSRS